MTCSTLICFLVVRISAMLNRDVHIQGSITLRIPITPTSQCVFAETTTINRTESGTTAKEIDAVPTMNNKRSNSIASPKEALGPHGEEENHITAQSSSDGAPGNVDTIIDLNDADGSAAIDASLATSNRKFDTTIISEKQSTDALTVIGKVRDDEKIGKYVVFLH